MNQSANKRDGQPVTRDQVTASLREAGLRPGQVVLVHSAMRTVGHVADGAGTVVEGFLDVLGPEGTLVVPTYTFAHEAEEDPLIDPARDPSEMGVITETARKRPDALRSTAYRHSLAAIGPQSRQITDIDPALSVFDERSSFGRMLDLDTQIVLLGMTYAHSTSHHLGEWICDVPYRHTLPLEVKVRRPDGSIQVQPMTDYQPKPSADGSYYGTRGPDFNRMGRMLEQRAQVGLAPMGNAAIRRYAMRDLVDLSKSEGAKDHNVFRTEEGEKEQYTPLDFGTIVISPLLKDGAGREFSCQWCVMDEAKLTLPAGS